MMDYRGHIISLRGMAIVRVSSNSSIVTAPKQHGSLGLSVSSSDGRSATMVFWSRVRQTNEDRLNHDVNALHWTLAGSGVFFQRTDVRQSGDEYGVAALWPVVKDAADLFAVKAEKNAMESVQSEVGCHAFGIFRSISDPSVFVLMEVFDGMASFNNHLGSDHFKEFIEFARPRYLGSREQTVKGVVTWS
jgi:quinol monooxygenase YgiN